jgi:hypothetical protein
MGIARSAIWPDDGRAGEPAAELFPATAPTGPGVAAVAARGASTGRRTRRQPTGGGAAGVAAVLPGEAASTVGAAPSPVGPPAALPWVAGAGFVVGSGDRAASAAGGSSPRPGPSAADAGSPAGSGTSAGPDPWGLSGVAARAAATTGPGSGATGAADPEVGLWDAHEIPVAPEHLPDPAAELVAARAALSAGVPDEAAVHLALALRLEPTMAPAILEAAGDQRSPALDLVRGDALRLVGHEAEARRAYASAARGMAGRSAERER